MSTKIWTGVAAALLAGTIGMAGSAAASSTADEPATPARERGARAAVVCEHLDEIDAKMAEHLDHMASRQTWLADKRVEAVAAGRDTLVAHIDRATARLTERVTKVQDRMTKLDTWAAAHCDAA